MAKGKVSKKVDSDQNLPELSDVIYALAKEQIELQVHYPSKESAVVTIGTPNTTRGKGLTSHQLRLITDAGGAVGPDMVIRIICHNG